jgi:hypothetical protein
MESDWQALRTIAEAVLDAPRVVFYASGMQHFSKEHR